ncbi:hypothetical protein BDN72DRAFT_831773 [Pluteus cervinus]|uniref:Uncharacterized protein n=1 Tax=Pluteus cervinus TaxID=181527 RepID=A0ACD3BCF5_9AGAR|nr:hypothetical protein BDN72DRAFT_831773 [Pluteus cervinus]
MAYASRSIPGSPIPGAGAPLPQSYYSPTSTYTTQPSPYPIHHPQSPYPSTPRASFNQIPSTDFQIERNAKASKRRSAHQPELLPGETYDDMVLRQNVDQFLANKNRVFAVTGSIPIDTSQLVLFFRTQSGITHSLDFPIDVSHNTPPALDVLIASCRPHQTQTDDYNPSRSSDSESLFFPPSLPLTTSLELSGHPVLTAIQNTLFPKLPVGTYHLTTQRDKLELLVSNGRMGAQPRTLRNDGRSATVIVTLPVKFRGGRLIVTDPEGREEVFLGQKGSNIEWTAFLADCEYEVETVTKGVRMMISYGIYIRGFGEGGVGVLDGVLINPDPLTNPSSGFKDQLGTILNLTRGRRIAFYVSGEYGVNPAEVFAGSLIPLLKGGDYLLYQALKHYKVVTELSWTAGGYIWPADRTVEILDEDESSLDQQPILQHPHGAHVRNPSMPVPQQHHSSRPASRSSQSVPPVRGMFNNNIYADPNGYPVMPPGSGGVGPGVPPPGQDWVDPVTGGGTSTDSLRARVEEGGAIPLAEAGIMILSPSAALQMQMPAPGLPPGAWDVQSPVGQQQQQQLLLNLEVGKERVPFVSNGELEKLVVNCLIVASIP